MREGTCLHRVRTQAGKKAAARRGPGAKEHQGHGWGSREDVKKTCRGASGDPVLVKQQRDSSRKIRTPAGM